MNNKHYYLNSILCALCSFLLLSNAAPALQQDDFACRVYVPNAFSPNDDGVNDTIEPFIGCPVTFYDFRVFNRWGQLMFSSGKPEDGWDGTFKGRPADANVYVYLLRFSYDNEGQPRTETKTGDIALVR
jgi:gliding motility-associated-like protein